MKQRISPASKLQIKANKNRLFLLPCAALLLLIFTFVFVPYIEAKFRASAASSTSKTADVTVGIGEAWASLSTPDDVNMVAEDVSSAGTIVSGSTSIRAATNAPTGYKLYLSASDMAGGNTANLVNGSSPSAVISPMGSSTPTTLSTANTWGYAVLGEDHFGNFSSDYSSSLETKLFKAPVHLSAGTPTGENGLIAQSNEPRITGSDTDIYYAARINDSTPSGTYSTNVTYILVAEFSVELEPDSPENPSSPSYVPPANGPQAASLPASDDNVDGGGSTALGVNNMGTLGDGSMATIGNINDGNVTWAAVAVVAGAAATFLAIALLRDRDEEDEEE